MGKFDFDKLPDRRNTYSLKWDVGDGVLPMWVADMDFESAPCVKAAVLKRAECGAYGYSYAPDKYFEAISDFWFKRHGYRFDTRDMIFSTGVVPAISSIVRRLTHPGEKVLISAPVYNIFYNSILNNGREVVSSDLVLKNGEYSIDFCDLEKKLSDPRLTLFILCNPHNPVGRVWKRDELKRIGELCHENGVVVLSDEIHCEFTTPKRSYVPFASVSDLCRDNSVSCISASKAFNIAGLGAACVVAHNRALYNRVYRGINNDEVGEPGAFAVSAVISAFREGEAWLDEMVDYVNANKVYAASFIRENIPSLSVPNSNATYLLWVDISALGADSVEFCEYLRKTVGLMISDGREYGECGRFFVRINLATSRKNVEMGLGLLLKGVNAFLKEKDV